MRRPMFGWWLLFVALGAAAEPATLLQLSGAQAAPAGLGRSVVVVIDAQREYVDGALPLSGMEAAVAESRALLARARRVGAPVVHVVHHGRAGGALFDPQRTAVAILPALTPKAGEAVVVKHWPDAFIDTDLERVLAATGRNELVVTGFMTHMCVSSTVRAALARGYRTTVVAAATATRDLPDGRGGVVSAAEVQRGSLAALADRFATVVERAADLPD